MPVDPVARCVEALGARLDVSVSWRGEGLDRLLDAAHARLVDLTVGLLQESGWSTVVEATFSRYGERGSIDVLARHPTRGMVLVVEVKSVVPDLQAMLAGMDRKARLAAVVVEERGWDKPVSVSRLLVLPAGRTTRRRVAEHRVTLEAALPLRGWRLRSILRDPGDQAFAGILLWPDPRGTTVRHPRPAARRAATAWKRPV